MNNTVCLADIQNCIHQADRQHSPFVSAEKIRKVLFRKNLGETTKFQLDVSGKWALVRNE